MILDKLSCKASVNKIARAAYKKKRDNGIVNLMLAIKENYKALELFPSTKAMSIELSKTPGVKLSAKTIAAIVGNSDRWESVKWKKPKASEVVPVAIVKPKNGPNYHLCAW